ncbi:alpha/beta fold hydrolase [Cognatishimia sp.]|uniref:alpha/beta fold hydrolase n=1 Tax=Cognatishimia sp. TaxID=2211648 RepID=UPI003510D44A
MDYFFSVRGRSGDHYSNALATPKYLKVPEGADGLHRDHEVGLKQWLSDVQEAACASPPAKGNILIFVHGFNTDQWDMLERHRLIRKGLQKRGYVGTVVSFDWPSDGTALGYVSDRRDARRAADYLFKHGITRLSAMQREDCEFNIHVLAHSMGSFLVREAFDYADDDHKTAQKSWNVSQVALVAADISAKSMRGGSPKTSSLLRHATRVTNYFSPLDEILSISEVKRIGVSRRLGRVGLPSEHSEKVYDVYCGQFYKDHKDSFESGVSTSHRWYFEADRFYEDLNHTLSGKLDREEIPTRGFTNKGRLALMS